MKALILFLGLGLTIASTASAASPIQPGDHVAIVGNTFADQLRTHGYFETLLRQRTAGQSVSIRNLGWGGDTLDVRDRPTNFPTEESTLKDHKTDVIIACFGMGESFAGEAGISNFRSEMKAFIASHKGKSYNGKSEVRLILVSPISYEDLGSITPNIEQRRKELASYSQTIAAIAAEAKIPFVDLNGPSDELMRDKSGPSLTHNGINLNEYGYWALSRHFADAIIPGAPPWSVELQLSAGTNTSSGLLIKSLNKTPSGVEFSATEKIWPSLLNPSTKSPHKQTDSQRDTLSVSDLPAGTYTLSVDGMEVVTASSEDWSQGVAIDNSPAHQELAAFRQRVNDKNQQFVYSWKALNQVHIVGERRQSPSGKALPKEVIAFNKIALKRDQELQSGLQLKTRQWRLVKK